MTDSKKLCPSCKKGYLEKKSMPQYLNIEGAPEFKVTNFSVGVCTNCATEMMSLSDSTELDKLFLEQLIQYYSKTPWNVAGKAANWMKKVIGMTARDLASLARIEESTLSHTFKKNTTLDRFAATVLLLKSRDFLNGSNEGNEVIKKLDDPDSFFQPQVPVDEIVRKITGDLTSIKNSSRRSKSSRHNKAKEDIKESPFNPQLYKRYSVNLQKIKR